MSILQEYDELKKQMGSKEWELINKYVDERSDLLLYKVLYNEEEYKKYQKWKETQIEKPLKKQGYER